MNKYIFPALIAAIVSIALKFVPIHEHNPEVTSPDYELTLHGDSVTLYDWSSEVEYEMRIDSLDSFIKNHQTK